MLPYKKHPHFTIYQTNPFNGGPPLPILRQHFLTPENLFYARNHGTIPIIDPSDYRLTIDGAVKQRLSFSLDALQADFPRHTQIATLQCAGNRRRELLPDADPVEQVVWDADAISTAEWTGVRLCDVLDASGLTAEAHYVAFAGLDQIQKDGENFGFGGSIPVDKALNAEVLLAYEMNGQPLSIAHGFPLRVLVPGYVAARSVKWLAEIILQPQPSTNYFQTRDYKVFPPEINDENVDWEQGIMLSELNLNAVICCPSEGDRVKAGTVHIQGYALASSDNTISAVEISSDGGASWVQTTLTSDPQRWVWCFWEADIVLMPGIQTLSVRAHDSSGSVQPAESDSIWNFKGYMNNAWHKITITVE